jgi:hypothetical protein
MPTRAEIEAILPSAAEAVFRETGVRPNGFGITGKNGGLALSVTLHEKPATQPPGEILGIPVVFQVVDPPGFLSRSSRPKAAVR